MAKGEVLPDAQSSDRYFRNDMGILLLEMESNDEEKTYFPKGTVS